MHKGWCIYFGYSDTITHGYNCAKILFYVIKKKKEFTQAIKMLPQEESFSVRNINCHNYELSPDALKYENYSNHCILVTIF